MFNTKQKNNKIGLLASIVFSFLAMLALICFAVPTGVFARQIDVPSYLRVTTEDAVYHDGDTIFLDEGKTLNISLGKPNQTLPQNSTFTNQSDIGDFALSNLATNFSLKINNVNITNPTLESADFLRFEPYIYQPTTIDPNTQTPVVSGQAKQFMFMDLTIDLSSDIFATGEYTFTFTNYVEYSQNNFSYNVDASFSFTLFIFNTTDYFTSNSATTQNTSFLNVEASTPNTVAFRNYYYFNYSNLNSLNSNLQNHLPMLTFDASKFVLNITKTISGNKFACEISKFNNSLVTLSQNTTSEFVYTIYDTQTNQVTVIFNDIGEYVLDYTFIYERYNHEKIELDSLEITACNEKNDVLYIFGGQMYYSGIASPDTEFKLLTEDKAKTQVGYSSDITYLLETALHKNLIKTDDISTIEEDDLTIKNIINQSAVTPVSTNQPAVIFNTNVKLLDGASKFYRATNVNGIWEFGNAETFKNNPFTESGTYLVKLVYTFDYYYTTQSISPSTKFVQYFFFSIDNSIPSVSIQSKDKQLNSFAYTNDFVTATLNPQSPFNSKVKLEVYSKTFNEYDYTLNQSATGEINAQVLTFTAEGNYMAKLLYGKNFSKNQTIYFTIDKTEISGVQVLPVNKNSLTGEYEKSLSPISFFTSQPVVVEWQEKLSGAGTKAYYKYIPFTQTTDPITSRIDSTVSGITTSYMLNLDATKIYDKASYLNTLNRITGSSVFSSQGLYIIYIADEAGHEKYISFCIDNSPIHAQQVDKISGEEKFVSNFDLVDSDQYILWGDYKLISLGIDSEDIENLSDPWIKTTLQSLYNPLMNNFADNIHSLSSKLYFTVEINKVYAKQTGTSLKLVTTNNTGKEEILLETTVNGANFANEITYGFYLMDETSLLFEKFANLFNQNATLQNAEEFVMNANKSFQITTSTDASNANIMLNDTQAIKDVSLINSSSTALLQAGYADSKNRDTLVSPNIRTKYYFATGQSTEKSISILTYRIKLNIKEDLNVSKITMYFYPFVVDDENGSSRLAKHATISIIYDAENPQNSLMTALSGTDNQGYYAYNINVDYDNTIGAYQTLAGKYVLVREYDNPNHINKYDFSIRESVFVVDRADIVSSPQSFESGAKSAVGSGVYVNILDGSADAVQFTNIYSAKNNPSTYILQTNKLPVVVYVPTMKYGVQNTLNYFVTDKTLAYYLEIEDDRLIRVKYLENNTEKVETSLLSLIYFGDQVVTQSFDKNPNIYKSTDFDITATITSSNGQTISTTLNGLNYYVSNQMLASGIYTVNLTQNALNGKNFPNVSSTFKFSFQIIPSPPSFNFTSNSDSLNAITFDTDSLGVTYTNENGKIKVLWTDPQNSEYFSKIDISQDANGNTPIYYYFTSASGAQISQTIFVKASDILTDYELSPRTHYFLIDLASIPNNTILNVYMQNERGVANTQNISLLNSLTSITKKLYVDRIAPTLNIEHLIDQTKFEGVNFGEYTRKFVDFDGYDATNGQKMYSIPLMSGALAKYAFVVENTNQNPLMNMFSTKKPVQNFYTEGYYYHIKQVVNLAEYSLPSLASLIATAKTNSNQTIQAFSYNTYYEITEIDLAGNASIYLIFVADSDNNTKVLQFDREETDIEQENYITFNHLETNQDIYAKTFLNITSIDLYSYSFLEFSVDDELYFTSSALPKNQAYKFSTLTSLTSGAEIVNYTDLLSFSPNSSHTLKIHDNILGKTYTFNLYVTNATLSYSLISSGEGLTISTNSLSPAKHFLASIKISSYDNTVDDYVVIYEAENNFLSNNAVSVNTSSSTYTFTIINPLLAYSYVFYDNYGNKYLEHHTVGSFVLSEDQKIKNHLDTVLITETFDAEPSTNSWYVGKSNIVYNFSSSDYFAYIKIYVLEIVNNTAVWSLQTDSLEHQYGISVSDKSNYTITQNGAMLCSISQSPIHSTVKQLTLYAPSQNLLPDEFTGGVYKFEITLVDQYDSLGNNTITERVLINNLTPITMLKDKNNVTISTEDAMYSEQLTIIVPSLPSFLMTEPEVKNFMFNYSSELVYNQTSAPLISGLVVQDAGNYEVKTFIKINQNYYQISSKPFIISESATAFYEVLVRSASGEFVNAKPTGNSFTQNNIVYFNHYIVNDEFNLFLNKNQYMEIISTQTFTSHECTSYIYEISNFNYAQSHNVSPYYTKIAISYIPKTNSILTSNQFVYETNDAMQTPLTSTNAFITVTQNDADVNSITIKFNGYYAIPENIITAKLESMGLVQTISSSNSVTSFTLSKSGDYTLSFTDVAGNTHLFTDTQGIEQNYFYQIRFIKGVPYLINGNSPINNAIYNDKAIITLPTALSGVYDSGGKPSIVVYKNDVETTVQAVNGEYILDESGYYKVYFNARVGGKELRQESYEFLILASKEYRSTFEYSEYGNYEIASVLRNGTDITSLLRQNYNLSSQDAFKTLAISLYDEKTGQGNYSVTILTNSGEFITENNQLVPQSFTVNFIIKEIGVLPIKISLDEGASTTKAIKIEFNALDLYEEIGECKLIYANQELKIDEAYLSSLNGENYVKLEITETGTHFVQVYSAGDNLLYSYKVIKSEPLNTVSILLIVLGVSTAIGITITVVLLRRRMKIK